MCLYPKKMINKKYTATEKNGGCVPKMPFIGIDQYGSPIYDERVKYIERPCGNCIECRKEKAREWQVRLGEEIKNWEYKYLITFTFAPKELWKVIKSINQKDECNAACGYAIRHCLERWRKDHKKSIRHWVVTELGHENTERIHMHGLLFSDKPIEFKFIERDGQGYKAKWKYWKYGIIHVGDYVSERTINYIVKYITKLDNDHKTFYSQIFASPGIGKSWIEKQHGGKYKYRPGNTIDYFNLNNGSRVALPTYYKNKLFNEQERELIWRDKLDQGETIINGISYPNTTDGQTLDQVQEKAREVNKFMEYGDDSPEYRKRPWNVTRRMLEHNEEWKRKKNREKRKSIMAELGIGCPEAY